MANKDEVAPQTLDAITNKLLTRLSEKGVYRDAMEGLDPKHRKELEAACERHAARQRKAGKAGW